MAYFTPFIDKSGLRIPTYTDIRDSLIDDLKSIYGTDLYLEIDSLDYQYISAVSLKIFDSLQAIELAYNNRGPQTAIGSGLDGVVKLNGIARLQEAKSTCQQILYGTAGTIITGGSVRDIAGYYWDLPTVTIGAAGSVECSITCQTAGSITAAIGTINEIATPTAGWVGTANLVAAVPGRSTENDVTLRQRQSISVALPSQTLLEGTEAALLEIANVSRAKAYENDTNVRSSEGFPPHSITCVVEGGDNAAVANAIFEHKGVGAYINGSTSVTIYDAYRQANIVRFFRPTYVPIHITVNAKRLNGWSPAMVDLMKQALSDYLNSLQLGEDVTISSLWGVVLSIMPDLKTPAFSVSSLTAGTSPTHQHTTDIALMFSEAAVGDVSYITITNFA